MDLGADAVDAERLLQHRERLGHAALARSARVHLLQGHDIGAVALDQRDDTAEIEARIAAVGAVDVPRHHPDGRAETRRHEARPRKRPTSACALQASPIQPATPASSKAKFLAENSVTNAVIW